MHSAGVPAAPGRAPLLREPRLKPSNELEDKADARSRGLGVGGSGSRAGGITRPESAPWSSSTAANACVGGAASL